MAASSSAPDTPPPRPAPQDATERAAARAPDGAAQRPPSARQVFDDRVLPHLDAAFNLARWLLREHQAAEDAVQEAALRAFRHIGTLREGDARPWLLAIVRNTCFSALERRRRGPPELDFDSAAFADELAALAAPGANEPQALLEQARLKRQIDAALHALSPPLREVIVLRELEGLDYAGIAQVAGVPIGTVMSRLSRARAALRRALVDSRGDA